MFMLKCSGGHAEGKLVVTVLPFGVGIVERVLFTTSEETLL